ncbi:hypothetical protein MRX96_031834 [Rhipicephalus microplus]
MCAEGQGHAAQRAAATQQRNNRNFFNPSAVELSEKLDFRDLARLANGATKDELTHDNVVAGLLDVALSEKTQLDPKLTLPPVTELAKTFNEVKQHHTNSGRFLSPAGHRINKALPSTIKMLKLKWDERDFM